MRHFLFEETISGENFIVGENSLAEARRAAMAIFDGEVEEWNIKYICEYTDDEAEMSGLDEY